MRMGTRTTTAQKNYISDLLFSFLCGSLGFCFLALDITNRKMMKCFSMKLKKYWESFCCYVLVVTTTPKEVFSRCNLSENSVQVLSSMHSNVQLLYLLLFFVVVVGITSDLQMLLLMNSLVSISVCWYLYVVYESALLNP